MLGRRLCFVGTLACALGLSGVGCGGSADADKASSGGSTSTGVGGKTGSGGKTGKTSSGGKTGTGAGGDTGTNPGPPTTSGATLGDAHQGLYHLGPVDFAETQWHNACAPGGGKYRPELQDSVGLGGEYLAGDVTPANATFLMTIG
jgi:hypothetical protein